MSWRAGAASVRVPVLPGVALEGYAARSQRSTHVHDPLLATAVAMGADDEQPVVVAGVDAIAVDRAFCADVAERAGVDRSRLILCASHTHSGPAGLTAACAPSGAAVDPVLRETFVGCCAQAACEALATLAPAELGFSRARSTGVSANRAAALGPGDARVSVLAVCRPGERAVAAIVLVACHPTVLGAASTAISADLPGALRTALPEAWGPLLVLNGAAADLSSRFTRRGQDVEELARLGRRLASPARRAYAEAESASLEPVLKLAEAAVRLPRKRPPAEHDLRALIRSLEEEVARAESAGRSEAVARQAATRLQGAARELELLGRRADPGELHLTALRLGALALLFAPAELSTVLGRRIERASPFGATLVVGYANGYCGYVVDGAHYARRTYESLSSAFAPESGDEVVATSRALLAAVAA